MLDQLGHTWDIGAALGRPPTLDPQAVAVALEICASEREMLDASTHFAMPPAAAVEFGDAQTTFLQSIGRDAGKQEP